MLTIGNLTLSSDIIAAPLAGLSDMGYRTLCIRYGAGMTVTEMVSVKGLLYNNKETVNLLKKTDEEKPCALQLFGCEPDLMAKVVASPLLDDFQIIDINMGCPVPKVVKNGEGSALMKDEVLAAELVSAAVSSSKGRPVTVKIRAGWESITAPRFAYALEKAGASMIAVHGRTRDMFYSGKCNLDVIKAVKENVSIAVVGNGDVLTPDDYHHMKNYTGCDGVMIGRGAVGNQGIFRSILNGYPTIMNVEEDVKYHLSVLLGLYPEKTAVNLMKSHIMYYAKGMKGAPNMRREAGLASTSLEILELAKRIGEKVC